MVPYIRVLCPWEWISASQGLVFEFLVLHAFSSEFMMMPMHEAIKWHINSIIPFVLHPFYLWGGFANYVYSLYGILEGAKQDVARHEVHFLSL